MKIKLLLLILFILQVFHVLAQVELKTAVEELLLKPDYKTATIGLSFIDLEDGRALFEMNENKLMIPASVLKIVTTASAIEILGPDYQFKTKIGYEGEIKNNILDGNLIILGGGDPTLGSIYFQDTETCNNFLNIWIQEIKSFGINKIIGNVIFDASDYDTENIPPTWIWEDVGNYYGAGASAFSVYDNFFEINFKTPKRSGELSEIISTNPKIEGLQMKNEVK